MTVYQRIKFHLNSLLYFQRYTLDKLLIAKIKKRRRSSYVNTGDMVLVLSFCHSPHGFLFVYQLSFNYVLYFRRYSLDNNVTDGRTDGQSNGRTKR